MNVNADSAVNDGSRLPVRAYPPEEVYCDYARAVDNFGAVGIAVIPMHLDDHNVPMMRGPSRLGLRGAQNMADRHPVANVGFICGARNRITVIDVDSADYGDLRWALAQFGDTPVIVRTPSGGCHAYYRYNGETRRIRPFANRPIDLIGGGMCIAPPTVVAGRGKYQFLFGDWADFAVLPKIPTEALHRVLTGARVSKGAAARRPGALGGKDRVFGIVHEGQRNHQMFLFGKDYALTTNDFGALVDQMQGENLRRCVPPLDSEEIEDIANSIGSMKERPEGLWAKGSAQRIPISRAVVAPLWSAGNSDAVMLHERLVAAHWQKASTGEDFAISPEGLAKARVFGKWSPRRYRNAIRALLAAGILIRVHDGGSKPHDTHRYKFAVGTIN